MKTNLKVVSVALFAVLSSTAQAGLIGSTPDDYERRAEQENSRQEKNIAASIDKSPEWMYKPPVSSNAVYASGTGVSFDMSMADHKARADAFSKICMTAGGKASQNTKIYRTDTEKASIEKTETAMRTSCKEVNLTGVEIKEVKHIAEGNRFRSFVLIAYPTGDANLIKKSKDAQKEKETMATREEQAFKELDSDTSPELKNSNANAAPLSN